ncbi:hypothetical protein [Enterococcus sp. LJL120]
MVALAYIIYWGLILVNMAWIALSLFFGIFYLSRKENGNLWVFAFLNVVSVIALGVTMFVFRTWRSYFAIVQYSSLIWVLIGILLVIALAYAILGREPKEATA